MTIEELKAKLDEEGIRLSEDVFPKLVRYAALLKEWNEKMNLTAITEEGEVFEKHFFDSLLLAKYVDFSNQKIADMGSGAGFPGMVIALAFPNAKVTLIDSTAKKFQFLEAVKSELGIANVSFHIGRVEEMKEQREFFDFVTARGFGVTRILVEVGAPLLKVGGTLICMKSLRGEEEREEAAGAIKRLSLKETACRRDALPSTGDVRLNYFLEKCEKTSPKYPRRWSEIVNHPLHS